METRDYQQESVLKDFMLTPAPSGYECGMAYKLKDYLDPICDETTIDQCGNCAGLIKGTEGRYRVMVFAHMDQLGFMVRFIEEDGYLQADRLGGVPEKVLPGLAVMVRGEDGLWHPGVFGVKSHHAESAEEKYRALPITSLHMDLGAKSGAEIREMGIHPGCPAVYAPSFTRLCGTRIAGTSVDNRGGCSVLVEMARLLRRNRPKCDVYLAGTVWEEFNLRGAMLAARSIKPDIAISLDVTLSGDTHDLERRYETALGQGACVQLYSFHGRGTLNGTLPHEPLFRHVRQTAQRLSMKFQRFAGVGILTDASYLQLEGNGIACLEMGFPARYTHSPVEVCDTEDLSALAVLCAEAAAGIDGKFPLARY